ncbi:uncharacterized protein SPAPADRAFT_49650 [Spathaspora passalidarum NRRL Y-27907]|uniref:Flo11 domain-containing protein n=1 Tax=Spathaspora passalidarum (strain NRRL Y-27907 / 11-Y1) TaxID=619300 RepID=G3ALT1_SPAPN|nr:uncharacterized protein SPAPADRAFT_49650 [Spathaspora passalidarum NRRL Y-27907]EGW32690.1 hypothetical protein SPAPADRAFT_49650 [Spathaspora passalidarum NRRL Y-27907]
MLNTLLSLFTFLAFVIATTNDRVLDFTKNKVSSCPVRFIYKTWPSDEFVISSVKLGANGNYFMRLDIDRSKTCKTSQLIDFQIGKEDGYPRRKYSHKWTTFGVDYEFGSFSSYYGVPSKLAMWHSDYMCGKTYYQTSDASEPVLMDRKCAEQVQKATWKYTDVTDGLQTTAVEVKKPICEPIKSNLPADAGVVLRKFRFSSVEKIENSNNYVVSVELELQVRNWFILEHVTLYYKKRTKSNITPRPQDSQTHIFLDIFTYTASWVMAGEPCEEGICSTPFDIVVSGRKPQKQPEPYVFTHDCSDGGLKNLGGTFPIMVLGTNDSPNPSSASEIDESSTADVDESSTVDVDGSSTVDVDGSSTVDVDESSTADVDGSSTVDVDESSTADVDGSSTVDVDGSSTVDVDGSSTVDVDGSSTVDVDESSTVDVDGSSTVDVDITDSSDADELSTVDVDGSTTSVADESSTVDVEVTSSSNIDESSKSESDVSSTSEGYISTASEGYTSTASETNTKEILSITTSASETWSSKASTTTNSSYVIESPSVQVSTIIETSISTIFTSVCESSTCIRTAVTVTSTKTYYHPVPFQSNEPDAKYTTITKENGEVEVVYATISISSQQEQAKQKPGQHSSQEHGSVVAAPTSKSTQNLGEHSSQQQGSSVFDSIQVHSGASLVSYSILLLVGLIAVL